MRLPRHWKRLERHPLSAEYPNITGRVWDRYVENLKQHGVVGKRKIVLCQGKVIDGWQLQRACVEAGIKPQYETLKLADGMTVEEYIETVNDLRRHETQEQAMKRADERRQRVAAARAAGMSQRAIAEQEGISRAQVVADLGVAGGQGCPPEPEGGRIKGRDGKTYQATKQTNPDRELEIPERLQPYFSSVPLFERAVYLARRVAKLFEEIEQTPAYRKAVEGKSHRQHSTYIRTAARAIESMTPKRPCPECGGKYEPSLENDPCKTCGDKGYQTTDEVEEE